MSRNILEPTRIEITLVFICQRQVLCDEPGLIDQPSIGIEENWRVIEHMTFFLAFDDIRCSP